MRFILFLGCFLLQLPYLFAQQPLNGRVVSAGYIIENIFLHNDIPKSKSFFYGNTQEWILLDYLDLKQGQSFQNLRTLTDKVEAVESDLNDLKILDSGSRVEITYKEVDPQTNMIKVDLDIYFKDTWNFLTLPMFRFDSNLGLRIGLRMRHLNFLGTMSRMNFALDVETNSDGRWGIRTAFSFLEPFRIKDHKWYFAVGMMGLIAPYYGSIDNTEEEEVPFVTVATLGSKWDMNERGDTFTFAVMQGLTLVARYNNTITDEYDPYYTTTRFAGNFHVKMFSLPWLGDVSLNSALSGEVSYRFEGGLSKERAGFQPIIAEGIAADNVKKPAGKNMREGIAFSTRVSFTYEPWMLKDKYIDHLPKVKSPFYDTAFVSKLAYFWPISPYVSFQGRLGANYYPFDDAKHHDMGEPLRGIVNERIKGDALLYANFDMLFKLWIGHLDNFTEIWLGLFYDVGWAHIYQDTFLDPYQGTGLELLIFPRISRSISFRISFGTDIHALMGDYPSNAKQGPFELYLGTFLHY